MYLNVVKQGWDILQPKIEMLNQIFRIYFYQSIEQRILLMPCTRRIGSIASAMPDIRNKQYDSN